MDFNDVDNVIIASHSSGDGVLASPGIVDGIATANDFNFTSVPTSNTVDSIVIYEYTGDPATSPLIAFIDTATGSTPISLDTNGGAVTIAWDTGANKIFKL